MIPLQDTGLKVLEGRQDKIIPCGFVLTICSVSSFSQGKKLTVETAKNILCGGFFGGSVIEGKHLICYFMSKHCVLLTYNKLQNILPDKCLTSTLV